MSCQGHTLLGQHFRVLYLFYPTLISLLVHIMPCSPTFSGSAANKHTGHKKWTQFLKTKYTLFEAKKWNNFTNDEDIENIQKG